MTVLAAAAFALTALAAPAPAQRKEAPKNDDGPKLSAPHAILIEAKSGSVLFERDADTLIYPASLAKLMTAEYVFHLLKSGKIKLTDEYLVSEHAWRTRRRALAQLDHVRGNSTARCSVDDAPARHDHPVGERRLHRAGRGDRRQRGQVRPSKLTQRAREIGLEKSTFANSNGLPDPDEQVTSRELAMLARHIILTYPEFYKLFGQPDFTWNKIHQMQPQSAARLDGSVPTA